MKPRRSWLFVAGADAAAHTAAARSAADVLILELEDFTPPELRPKARQLSRTVFDDWRRAGKVAAVRINPLEGDGVADLRAVLAGRPDIVMMSKVTTPDQVHALELATRGEVELVPNVETAAGLLNAFQIGKASRKVAAMLVASEDMVASLGTNRSRGGEELAYVRSRFLVDCRAAGVEAIDCPYTFSDAKGAAADARYAKQLGYRMKSLVAAGHAGAINKVFSVGDAELKKAAQLVRAFEKARQGGKERAKVDGKLVEVPIYAAAKRLLQEHAQRVGESVSNMPPPKQKKRR
jgi:citrate lyase subunit beta/citryl-CoA lyase